MPKPRIVRPKVKPVPEPKAKRERKRRATDHRGVVLESITTTPGGASKEDVFRDCIGDDFPKHSVDVMIDQLKREGLIDWFDEAGVYFITRAGFDYLTHGTFDMKVPEFAPRRRKRVGGRYAWRDANGVVYAEPGPGRKRFNIDE